MEKTEESAKKTKRPTALKRDLQSEKRRLQNKSFRAEMRTVLNALDAAIQTKDDTKMAAAFNKVQSQLDKGVKRGIFKANKANRTKSRIKTKTSKVAIK